MSIASAGVTFQMFNTAFLSGPVATEAELKQRILQPIMHFNYARPGVGLLGLRGLDRTART